MRVNGSGVGNVGERQNQERVGDRGQKSATVDKPGTATEAVVVSAAASDLVSAAGRGKAVHAERVEKVRQAIKNGTYKVDLDRLAAKIADEEIGGSRRG